MRTSSFQHTMCTVQAIISQLEVCKSNNLWNVHILNSYAQFFLFLYVLTRYNIDVCTFVWSLNEFISKTRDNSSNFQFAFSQNVSKLSYEVLAVNPRKYSNVRHISYIICCLCQESLNLRGKIIKSSLSHIVVLKNNCLCFKMCCFLFI